MNFEYQTILIISCLFIIISVLIFIVFRLYRLEKNTNSNQLSVKTSEKPPPEKKTPPVYEENETDYNQDEQDTIQALMSMHNKGHSSFQPDEESITEVEEVEEESD